MKTYSIADHVPESELTAITREGAERWLERRGWTRELSLWCAPPPFLITVPCPKDIDLLVNVIGVAVTVHRMGPRAIIAEMQADTRIIEAGRKVAGP